MSKGAFVYEGGSEGQARLLAGALEASGIPASVTGGRIAAGYGGAEHWRIAVASEHVADARDLIRELEAGTVEPATESDLLASQIEAVPPLEEAHLWAGQESGFPREGVGALASPWDRILARFIDWALLTLPSFLAASVQVHGTWWRIVGATMLSIAYEVMMTAYKGQTLGKMALGIAVVRPGTGRPGLIVALRRAVLFYLSVFVPLVPDRWHSAANLLSGLIWTADSVSLLIDRNHQTLHDRLAGTFVIRIRDQNVSRRPSDRMES